MNSLACFERRNSGCAKVRSTPAVDVQKLGRELASVMDQFYVHLKRVRQQRGFDPVAALRNVETIEDLQQVFSHLGDRHTFLSTNVDNRVHDGVEGGAMASSKQPSLLEIPLRIERCNDHARSAHGAEADVADGADRFFITATGPGAPMPLTVGTEVTHWNGVPMARAATREGQFHRPAHKQAALALGLRTLTQRLVGTRPSPEEDWVVLSCKSPSGRKFHQHFDWSHGSCAPRSNSSTPSGWRATLTDPHSGDGFRCGLVDHLDTKTASEASPRGKRNIEPAAAYVRLFSIPPWELLRPLRQWLAETTLAHPGLPLVLDLRGNSGGEVDTVERLAWLLRSSETMRLPSLALQFRDTPGTRALSRSSCWSPSNYPSSFSSTFPSTLDRHKNSFEPGSCPKSESFGPPANGFLPPLALIQRSSLEAIKPIPIGRIVVVVDALTFSAAEILVALLRSRQPEKPRNQTLRQIDRPMVVGADSLTGCGPDNAFPYQALLALRSPNLSTAELRPKAKGLTCNVQLPNLPAGMDLQLSVRRALLVHAEHSFPIESEPVDSLVPITKDDLFFGNRNLIRRAVQLAYRGIPTASRGTTNNPNPQRSCLG